ncbi:hypothetical protein FNF29_01633 [Cafeteria roenbergensis]|uniref:Protein kinase domain-containing protein n=1 Tax=Cafeteria roenbergensis TaxID=33653 RepID=A0A5A8CSJ5_CAFRO|nr:hypothetical protein FNF29_01633 [Cafeteria roenbergensis]|eukprot:KAA0155718.1 hypothetical protein FNF29_01633 [Cafeteria roenbergensis]
MASGRTSPKGADVPPAGPLPGAAASGAGVGVSAELRSALARRKERISEGSESGRLAGVIEEEDEEEEEEEEGGVDNGDDHGRSAEAGGADASGTAGAHASTPGTRRSAAASRRKRAAEPSSGAGETAAAANLEGREAEKDETSEAKAAAKGLVEGSTRSAGQLEAVLPLVLEWVAASELMGPLPLVSRAWSRAAAAAFNWRSAEVSEEVVDEEDVIEGPEEDEEASEEEAVRRVLQARADEARAADGTVTLSGIRLAVPLISSHAAFHKAHPWGAFLSEGAYKKVYAVWNKALGRREAVSVMDVEAIADAGACDVVRAEVRCACLVSELVRTGVCPNFVQTFQVLATSFEPSEALWGTEHCRLPRGPLSAAALRWASDSPGPSDFRLPVPAGPDGKAFPNPNAVDLGVFQLARMELCSGGDVEEHLRSIEPLVAAVEQAEMAAAAGEAPASASGQKAKKRGSSGRRGSGSGRTRASGESPPDSPLEVDRWFMGTAQAAAGAASTPGSGALGLIAQLLASLLAARDRLCMRHWDVKLLNCLLMPSDAVRPGPRAAGAAARGGPAPSVLAAESDPALGQLAGASTSRSLAGAEQLDGVVLRYGTRGGAQPAATAARQHAANGGAGAAETETSSLVVALPRSERAALPRGWLLARASEGGSVDESVSAARLQLAAQPGFVLKLADFGTADTREASLGHPVRARHVTTLENTALDLLVMGDSTKQDFHADSWAAGLCVLHLLTGAAPYEEVLEEVTCPAPLRKALYDAWTGRTWGRRKRPAAEPGFAALEPVLREDEEDGTLADTLARIVVLFGLPGAGNDQASGCAVPAHLWTEEDAAEWGAPSPPPLEAPEAFSKSVVWRTLQQWLGPVDAARSGGPAKRTSTRARRPTARSRSGMKASSADADGEAVRAWFKASQERFNVWVGNHGLMQRARRRMAAAPGTAALLWALCQFDPEKRPRASDLLAGSAALEPLRQAGLPGGAAAASLASYGEVSLPALACPTRDDV